MKIELDLNKLEELGITPNEYTFILLSVLELDSSLLMNMLDLEKLQSKGYLKITPDGVSLRAPSRTLVNSISKVTKVEEWIDEWRNLWPSGVKSGGRPIRGNRGDCLKKMTSFIETTSYTKEEIIAATLAYIIDRKHDRNYAYMTCADYFIKKEGTSLLESWCEEMKTRGGDVKDFNPPTFNDAV